MRRAFRRRLWAVPLVVGLAGLGYWLFPEAPELPAVVLVAVTVPVALVGIAFLTINERREAARARAADYGEGDD